ncbi:MAG: hypothetical protein C0201_03305 [Caldisphaera sp.]|nr:MAG: hypothetical protein C0201_03305 [Caldisphaera sp.]
MEVYKLLGLIGSIIIIALTTVIGLFMIFGWGYYYGMMGYGYYGMMGYYKHYAIVSFLFFFMPIIIGIIAGIIGIIGASLNDNVASGILFIIASFISITMFFGGFGIGFILLLIGGILALLSPKRLIQ